MRRRAGGEDGKIVRQRLSRRQPLGEVGRDAPSGKAACDHGEPLQAMSCRPFTMVHARTRSSMPKLRDAQGVRQHGLPARLGTNDGLHTLGRAGAARRTKDGKARREQIRHVQDRRRDRDQSARLRRHAHHRPGHLGRAAGSDRRRSEPEARAGARHRFHRHRQFLRARRLGGADPRGTLSL